MTYQAKYFTKRDPFIDLIKKTARQEENVLKGFEIIQELFNGKI